MLNLKIVLIRISACDDTAYRREIQLCFYWKTEIDVGPEPNLRGAEAYQIRLLERRKSAFVDGLQAKMEAQLSNFQKQQREEMHAELQAFRKASSTPAYTRRISLSVDIVEIKSESENEDDQCPVQSPAISNTDLKSEDEGPDASDLDIYDATPGPARMAEAIVEDLPLILSQALNPNFHQDQHSKKAQLSPFRNKSPLLPTTACPCPLSSRTLRPSEK
ncbi:hypothetical protein LZ554_001812 [Drepanopeziza brunnea f. sp. 'monogermtubi']|nr:hypothetical protein LZ554_001812 [Drepanopeziza brunnea f. sp. 'monogermtubi']